MAARGTVEPAPPLAAGVALPWDVAVEDAVAEIARARAAYGDTFLVESGGDRYLFLFSPTGVESFYALPEEVASKGVADYLMLRRKLPPEIFDGRRTLPGTLFRKGDVAVYLDRLERALDAAVAELGEAGKVEVFGLTRRLGHRMGLASWGGPGSTDGATFERLVAAFDTLDGAESFVHPDLMRAVAESGHAAERAALAEVEALVGEAVDRLAAGGADSAAEHGLFARICGAWADEPDPALRRQGVARDVALVHVASMSNLASALGWALVDLVEHPDELAAVRAGDTALAGRCALETVRVAQRSIMSRHVLAPARVDAGDAAYDVGPGVTVATLLPLTNLSPDLGHDRWDPSRWDRHRFTDTAGLASPQLVTAFGHGRHTCPAQPFSIAAMTAALTRLLGRYDVTPQWSEHPRPVAAQIGGVARAGTPCRVGYRQRTIPGAGDAGAGPS